MRAVWFLCLFSSICLEGLGRKYLPQVPSVIFYFFKDIVLLVGWVRFRPSAAIARTARWLYRGFGIAAAVAMGWTVIELFNPEHQSFVLGLVGLRAYWLWWIAPVVIAGVLRGAKNSRRAIYVLLLMAVGIAMLAIVQFRSPPDSAVNLYTVVDGQELYAADAAVVSSTGKARVASTFAFLSGFEDFTILIPTLLLSIGLEEKNPRLRYLALTATLITAAVVPMSGSRSSILLGIGVLLITAWAAGLLFTRTGRRIVIGATVAAILAVVAFPEALIGVESRFEDTQETRTRLQQLATVLPPVALVTFDYPMMGIGTGMQQNGRTAFRVHAPWEEELEVGRYLVELGPIGFMLFWTARIGLVVALLRAYLVLKRAGRRGPAGAALSYAALTMLGNLVFDHVWQALFFLGCGFILAQVMDVLRIPVRAAEPASQQSSDPRVGSERPAIARG